MGLFFAKHTFFNRKPFVRNITQKVNYDARLGSYLFINKV